MNTTEYIKLGLAEEFSDLQKQSTQLTEEQKQCVIADYKREFRIFTPAIDALKEAGIITFGDLLSKNWKELDAIDGFGLKSRRSVLEAVRSFLPEEKSFEVDEQFLQQDISDLGLTNRTWYALIENSKVRTIQELVSLSEPVLGAIRDVGPSTISEIKKSLQKHGLSLPEKCDPSGYYIRILTKQNSLKDRYRPSKWKSVRSVASEFEHIAVQNFRKKNPDLTLENSVWAGCRVTFLRPSDEYRTSVDLYILPENYTGEREGFSLTVEERQMAYEELDSRGIPGCGYVIEKAEMFQFIRELENGKEKPKIDDLIKAADSKKSLPEFRGQVPQERPITQTKDQDTGR